MIAMNAAAKLQHAPEAHVAANFLSERLGIPTTNVAESAAGRLLRHTREHLELVAVSLTAAVLVAVPLGMLAARSAAGSPRGTSRCPPHRWPKWNGPKRWRLASA